MTEQDYPNDTNLSGDFYVDDDEYSRGYEAGRAERNSDACQWLNDESYLLDELSQANDGLEQESAELRAKLEKAEKRLGLFLQGDTSLSTNKASSPLRWFVIVMEEYPYIIELSSGLTPLEAIDNAIKEAK